MAIQCSKCQTDNPDTSSFCADCGTKLLSPEETSISRTKTLKTPIEELTTGSTFAGRYQIIEELGKGGMGRVYKANDIEIKEKVALKLIKPEIAADKRTIERFRNELKYARKIRHENACQMYDLGTHEGSYFITMEYVAGEDLKSFIRRSGQLTVGKSISIAKQVCEGLSNAHMLGIIHRDLKPSNIMIDKEGNARIMDFGIACSLEAKGITESGMMVGTPDYMSPEQVEGKKADKRSDIYSLGVVFYEMVTGKVPFEGETPFSIALKHKTEVPTPPKKLNVIVPDSLSRVILKCMKKDKNKRYQDIRNLIAALDKIEKDLPKTEQEIPGGKPYLLKSVAALPRWKKLFITALIVISAAVIGIITWKLIPQKEAIHVQEGKPSIAVLYFKNNTGDENLNYLRSALSDLLITDLSQSKLLKVVGWDELFKMLKELDLLEAETYSPKVLKDIAILAGVSFILSGTYSKSNDIFRIDYVVKEASTMNSVDTKKVEGKEGRIFALIDQMSRKIKLDLNLSSDEITSDLDEEIGKITTNSPKAYKYYIEGRGYHQQGKFRQSIQAVEKAVTVDPEFAMAYRAIAQANWNLGYYSEARKYFEKALELKDRLSSREYYLIQGDFYKLSEKTYDKAIEAFNQLLELYPEDSMWNINLGIIYFDLEEWDKAIELYDGARQKGDSPFLSHSNLAGAYEAKGMYDKAREVLENYLANYPDNATIRRELSEHYFSLGENELSLVEADKASQLEPNHYFNYLIKGSIFLYKGDLAKAEAEFQKLMGLGEPAAYGIYIERLASLYLLQGKFEKSKMQAKFGSNLAKRFGEKWAESQFLFLSAYRSLIMGNLEEALDAYDRIWKIAVETEDLEAQRNVLYYKGLTYLAMDSKSEVQKTAEELKKLTLSGMHKKATKLYIHLLGMMELRNKNYTSAIKEFDEAISFLPGQYSTDVLGSKHALFINSLAFAHFKSGDIDKAREEYEKILSLTTGRYYYGDIYARCYYMLGKICEQKGWEGKAIEHYEKFLDLWKDADPGIVEVEDAEKRLAGLKSQ